MAEIYRNSVGKGIALSVPGATPTSALLKRAGESVVGQMSDSTVLIPFSITSNDGVFEIEWTVDVAGDSHVITETHEIVTPVFSKSDLFLDSDLNTLTDEQVQRLESLVRKVIEAHTGQTFGLRKGYTLAYGSNNSTLTLSERVASLDDSGYRVSSGGYALFSSKRVSDDVNIKVPAEEEAFYNRVHGVSTSAGKFRSGTRYRVYGTFGWTAVPEDIKLAALALAEEFSCDESLWKDRYIKAIRAADWRFDFSEQAFAGTGSVTADHLLAKYIVNRAVVI